MDTLQAPPGLCQCGCGASTPLGKYTDQRTGIVRGQPVKYLKGHGTRSRLPEKERFEEHLYPDPNSGCFLYVGKNTPEGYGRFRRDGRHGAKFIFAHHMALLLAGQDIPPEMCVLHKCDTPACCNPDHLFIGTRFDNNIDKIAKGRARLRPGKLPSGVHFHRRSIERPYVAVLPIPGIARQVRIGSFSTCEEAVRELDEARAKMFAAMRILLRA